MKKIFAKVGAIASAAALAVMSAPTIPVRAAEDYQGEVSLYIGFGGSGETAGDWGLQYNSPDNDGNNADIVSTSATAKVGDTVTISLEFPEAVTHAYWVAPVVYTEGDETVFGSVDADVSLKIDGVEVEIDNNADAEGKLSWAEGTGDYANSWRLYGGTNEWATQYVAQDVFEGATSIEYTITINSITEGEAVKLGPAYEGDTTVYIGFGGDLSESGDWGMQYNSPDDGGNNTDIVASNATAKVGDTVTVSLEFPVAVSHAYWVAPVIVSSDDATEFGAVDATVTLSIDGKEVDIDASAGDAAWAEGTGQYVNSWRLYGGTNEWAAQYVPQEAFEGASKIEYTITINAIHETAGAPVSSAGPVDLSGTYNAYIGLQTPKYSFRNSWSESSYGLNGSEGSEYFERITSWTDDGSAFTTPGTITDAVIEGNGTYTVSVTGIEWPEGEFADQDYMNQIFISTDIPNTGEVTISNVVLTIDNTNVSLASAGAILSPDDVDYMTILIQNIWNSDVTTIGYYSVPFTDISISFDVAGFDYDKAAQDAPADEPPTNDEGTVTDQADDGAETVETSSEKGLVVGIVVVVIAVAAIACGVVLKKRSSGKGDAK